MKNFLRWLLACAMLACLCGCMVPAQAQDSDGWTGQNDRDIVSVGHNSELPAGENAEDVVAVMGNSEVDGDVSDSAVAVMGNVTVNGTVGSGGAVAVLGNAYINGKVDGDVVAVLGNVKLGPQAVINGEVTESPGDRRTQSHRRDIGRHCRRPLRSFRRCGGAARLVPATASSSAGRSLPISMWLGHGGWRSRSSRSTS